MTINVSTHKKKIHEKFIEFSAVAFGEPAPLRKFLLIMRLTLLLFSLMMLLTVGQAFAQETTSEIQGVVQGENGQALQGATVTALHQPTGTRYTTTTRNDGRYNLANLRVGGPYLVTVSFVGFQEGRQTDINLSLGI